MHVFTSSYTLPFDASRHGVFGAYNDRSVVAYEPDMLTSKHYAGECLNTVDYRVSVPQVLLFESPQILNSVRQIRRLFFFQIHRWKQFDVNQTALLPLLV